MKKPKTSNRDTLAIHGGAPVRATPMPPRFALGPTEEKAIAEAIAYYRARGLDPGYQGHFEDLYCRAFADFHGGGHADAVASGTAALYVAVAALELPKGTEVIVSPITDPGTLSAVILNGLVPKLADSAPGGFNIDAERFRARVTADTRAVVVVHAFGQAADIEAIAAEAKRRDIRVVEDCSQSHGARQGGRPVGTFGDVAAFSTMYRKAHVTGACGGVVYTRNQEIFRRALAHADRGKPRWRDDFDDRDPNQFLMPALNLHSDEISCAIGIRSLARMPDTIERRRRYVAGVVDGLAKADCGCTAHRPSAEDSPFVLPAFVDSARVSCDAETFAGAVAAEGIGLNPHYQYLVADWPWLKPHLADGFDTANARLARDRSFNLYLNENYGAAEVRDTVAAIAKVARHFRA